jgi:hypothetical protein
LFDSTFFQLLRRFSEISNSVHYDQGDGRVAFERMYNALAWPAAPVANTLETIEAAHSLLYRTVEPELGPYFRTLYHVFKFIHEDKILTEDDKCEYVNIARAQLSKYELLMIFYNCLTSNGSGFKPLIVRYGILKHINDADLKHLHHKTDPTLYSPTAFMSKAQRQQYVAERP